MKMTVEHEVAGAAAVVAPKNETAPLAEPPKTLDEYAKAILEAHQCVDRADNLSKRHGREAIAAAIKAGQYLNAAKVLVGHGNWLKWLAKNCTCVSDSTAQRYMKIAKTAHVKYLKECASLRQAYIFTGAIKAGHLDKNPDEEPTPNENEPVEDETPQTILTKLERKIAGCQGLYKSLVTAEPKLEDNLFDCCDELMPLPMLLDRLHYSLNDALYYFGLPEIQVACVRCGRVKKPDDFFESIYPNIPAYSARREWCNDCIAFHATSKQGMDLAVEIPALTENVTEFKSLSVKDYTFALKYYQLVGTTIAAPSIIAAAEGNVWTPSDLENERDTIAAIKRLSPKIVLVKDKAAHVLWNVYRHFVSSAVNYPTPGRYIKFFVVDASQSGKPVLGIGAISGDFPALGHRDDFIGWTKEQKEEGKLNHTAVASTIVATQPFGFNTNGAKLLAALTTSRQIRDEWQSQYGDVLAGMTTTSLYASAKSLSMYDQIDEWKRLGETTGRVPIQPKPDIYRKWLEFLKYSRAHEFREMMTQDADVSGPVCNYKTKVVTMIYKAAGLKLADFLHGHRRGIYFSEFYENTRDFLCGRVPEDGLKMKPLFQETVQQITDRWREQAIKRYQTLKAKGALKPQKHSYSQLGQMDFQTARKTFLDDVGR
jgi:Domain of unknown function (DUF4338)/Protein of unknown function (DUF3102)